MLKQRRRRRKNNVDYPAFRDYVQDNIRDFLPEEYADATVSVYSVNKINNGEKEGFTVRKPGVKVAPTLYLDNMYEHYQESQNGCAFYIECNL